MSFRWTWLFFWGIVVLGNYSTFAENHTEAPIDDEEFRYRCEKYCHMNCKDIPSNHPGHKEQCEYVHSHESECHCHFGGTIIGVFVAVGLGIVLIVMCCICRHCRAKSKRKANTTNIVVVAQPETVTTITHNDGLDVHTPKYFRKHPPQQIYSIETVPQADYNENYVKPWSNTPQSPTLSVHRGVTVITNSSTKAITGGPGAYANLSPPSQRVYFEKVENSNEDPEDPIFLPPKYS